MSYLDGLPFAEYLAKPRTSVLRVFAADDSAKAEPVCHLLVNRVVNWELYPAAEGISSATVSVFYSRLGTGASRFETFCFNGGFSAFNKSVSLSSTSGYGKSGIFLDLPGLYGLRVGTFLMSEMVAFAKCFPDCNVYPISLSKLQAGPENLKRRNAFYENVGLRFKFDSDDQFSGESLPILARDLVLRDSWKQNIDEIELDVFLNDLVSNHKQISDDLNFANKNVSRLGSELLDYYNRPLFHAFLLVLGVFKNFFFDSAGLVVLFFILALVYFKFIA